MMSQARPQLLDSNREESLFDTIYQAAIDQDKEKIDAALSIVCIDVFSFRELHVPVSKLAAEGKLQAVDFLTKHYNVQPYWIIAGLSFQKDKSAAYAFLEKSQNEHSELRNIILRLMVAGFVESDDKSEVYNLLTFIHQTSPTDVTCILQSIAYGIAKLRHQNDIDEFLEKVKTEYPRHLTAMFSEIFLGLGRGNRENEAATFLTYIKSNYPEHAADALINLGAGYAEGRHKLQAYRCISQIMTDYPKKINTLLVEIALHFAASGGIQEAQDFLVKTHAEFKEHATLVLGGIISGLAESGYLMAAYQLIADAKPDDISYALSELAFRFVILGNIKQFDAVLKKTKIDYPDKFENVLTNTAFRCARTHSELIINTILDRVQTDYPENFRKIPQMIAYGLVFDGYRSPANTFLETVAKKHPSQLVTVLIQMTSTLAMAKYKKSLTDFFDHTQTNYPRRMKLVLIKALVTIHDNVSKSEAHALLKKLKINYPKIFNSVLNSFAFDYIKSHSSADALEFLLKIRENYPTKIRPILLDILKYFQSVSKEQCCVFIDQVFKLIHDDCTAVLSNFLYQLSKEKNIPFIYDMLAKIKNEYLEAIPEVLERIGKGLAESCQTQEVIAFLKKVETEFTIDYPDVLAEVTFGFSRSGRINEALECLASFHLKSLDDSGIIERIAYFLALHGYLTEACAIFDKAKIDYPNDIERVLEKIAYGLAEGNHEIKIKKLLAEFDVKYPHLISILWIGLGSGYAKRGLLREAYQALDHVHVNYSNQIESLLSALASAFVRAGNDQIVSEFLFMKVSKDYPQHISSVIQNIAATMHGRRYCLKKEILSKVLALIDDPVIRSNLAKLMQVFVEKDYSSESLLPRADKFNHFMKQNQINYDQAACWIQPELQILLLQGSKFINVHRFPASIFLYIVSFIHPITQADARDLSNKFLIKHYHASFFSKLGSRSIFLTSKGLIPVNQTDNILTELKNSDLAVRNVGSNQSVTLPQAEITLCILFCLTLMDKSRLPPYSTIKILMLLSGLSEIESCDLFNKFTMRFSKNHLFANYKHNGTLLLSQMNFLMFSRYEKKWEDNTNKKSSLLKVLTELVNPDDEYFLKEANKAFESNNYSKKVEYSTKILSNIKKHGKPDVIFRLSANNNAFISLCLDEKLPHYAVWSNHLKAHNYIGEQIESIDRKIKTTLLDEYIGSYFYDFYCQMRNREDRDPSIDDAMLEIACDLGVLYALTERIKQQSDKLILILISNSTTSNNKLLADQQLKENSKMLCNQFWSLGYLYMSLIYLHIGNSIANQTVINDTSLSQIADHHQLKAYKLFLGAKELDSHKKLSQNTKVIESLCKEKGLSFFGAANWDEGERYYLQHLRKTLCPTPILQKIGDKIKDEIREKINPAHQQSYKI